MKDKVPPDKTGREMIIRSTTQYFHVGLEIYDGLRMILCGEFTDDWTYLNVPLVPFSILTLDSNIFLCLRDDFSTYMYIRSDGETFLYGTSSAEILSDYWQSAKLIYC